MAAIVHFTLAILLAGYTRSCPVGWLSNGNGGGGFCFLFSHNQVTWTEALEICESFDSKLAEPQNADIDKFIGAKAVSFHRKYWMGASDIVQEGHWTWMSTTDPLEYTNWHAPDPNNGGTTSEDCLMTNWFHAGKWADGNCEWKEYFICQTVDDDISGIIG